MVTRKVTMNHPSVVVAQRAGANLRYRVRPPGVVGTISRLVENPHLVRLAQGFNQLATNTMRHAFRRWRARYSSRKRVAVRASAQRSNTVSGPVAGKYARPSTVYGGRRRRGGRYARKRFRRFAKKVSYVLRKQLPTQTVVTTNAGSESLVASDQVKRVPFMIFTNDDAQTLQGVVGGDDIKSSNIYVQNARMDVTVHNNSSIGQIVEMYDIVCRKDVPWGAYTKITDILNPKDQYHLEGSKLADFSYMGLSPFQSHNFCELFRIKRKKVFNMEPYSPSTFTIHGRRGIVDTSDWSGATDELMYKSGWSCGTLLYVRGYPGSSVSAPLGPVRLDWYAVKTFSVKVVEFNKPTIMYVPKVTFENKIDPQLYDTLDNAGHPLMGSTAAMATAAVEPSISTVSVGEPALEA